MIRLSKRKSNKHKHTSHNAITGMALSTQLSTVMSSPVSSFNSLSAATSIWNITTPHVRSDEIYHSICQRFTSFWGAAVAPWLRCWTRDSRIVSPVPTPGRGSLLNHRRFHSPQFASLYSPTTSTNIMIDMKVPAMDNCTLSWTPGAKTIKKNTNPTQNKSKTHRAKQYEVTSFLSTDCELSTETCSKNVYSLGPLTVTKMPLITSQICIAGDLFNTKF